MQNLSINAKSPELPVISLNISRVETAHFSRRLIGTGLGLALVKSILEAHHGSIKVTSELNRGSTFTVLVPIAGSLG